MALGAAIMERLGWQRIESDPWEGVQRAQPGPAEPANLPDRLGYAWGIPPGGLNEVNQADGAATQTDRKSQLQELWEGYLSCPWAFAAVQAISRTVTAGGLTVEWDGDTDESDPQAPDKPPAVVALENLISFCNPQQDIRQLLRNAIADLLVFGDAYIEVVWWGNVPVALFNQDSPTTMPISDEHGTISKYVQVTDWGRRADFETKQIIHISLDSARPGVFGIGPMQPALGPVTAWMFAAATGKETYRKGNPPNMHVDFPQSTSDPDMTRWVSKYRTRNLGPRNIGTPVTTKGGAKVQEMQAGRVADLLAFLAQKRDEILAVFGTPPAKVTVIESGNLGGGTGEAQDKSYRIDTCQPIANILLEKLQFHLAVQAFGVEDWHLKLPDVDYRDSKTIEDIRDERVRNGIWTRNRAAADVGEPPVEGGDDAMLVLSRSAILYKDLAAMSAQATQPKAIAPPMLTGLQGVGGDQSGQDQGGDQSGQDQGGDQDQPPPAKGAKDSRDAKTEALIADYYRLAGRPRAALESRRTD